MKDKETPEQREQRILDELNADILNGKVSMRPHWLPEIGKEIDRKEFDEAVRSETISNSQIILPPNTGGKDPYDPSDRFAWGVRNENEIIYTKIPLREIG